MRRPGPGLSLARSAQLGDDATLVDGVAGLRGRLVLGRGFHPRLAADIGGGSSRLTWHASGGVGNETGWAGVTLSYRHLFHDQGGGGLLRSFSFGGPFLAVKLTF